MHEFMFFLMLFVYIYKCWHPTRFPYHMMFVTFTCNTTGVSSGTGTAYLSGASEFTPALSGVHVVQFCSIPVCPSSIYRF
jgi:hypothetical protein